jgi:hypothetical protein
VVRKAIEDARWYWDETGDLAGTIARLVAPISKYQPFRDANHRTAHAIAHGVLKFNGFSVLAPDNDVELEGILVMDRNPDRSLTAQVEALEGLFRRRFEEGYTAAGASDEPTQRGEAAQGPDADAHPV